MYAYLKGIIEEITEDNLVLDVNNVGYNVKISAGTMTRLPAIGEFVKIYTYTCVREDTFSLYGFLSKDDLEIFKQLITVNGIGPKGGLAILSVMSADDLRFSILSGDAKAISKAPGIGARTAERIILDLKGKVSLEDSLKRIAEPTMESTGAKQDTYKQIRSEAIEALVALGYGATEAMKAVNSVEINETMDVEQVLKLSLKALF